MKKLSFVLLLTLLVATTLSSCRSTKKGCKGNGSWYGNRNLATQADTIIYITKLDIVCRQH